MVTTEGYVNFRDWNGKLINIIIVIIIDIIVIIIILSI